MSRKVLVVTNMYPEPDRPVWGTFIKSQVDSLTEQGVDIDVMVIYGYRNAFHYLLAIPRLWLQLWRQQYDLIHAHYGLSGLVARMQIGTPVLVSYCGDDLYGHAGADGRPTQRSSLLVWAHRRLARYVDAVIVKSRAMGNLIPEVAVNVVPNGVDMERFRPLDRADCRQQLALDPAAIYILFPHAKNRPRKNFALLEAGLQQLNKRHGIQAQALIVDNVPNERMPLYLGAANAMALTSFWEGSPNAVKEAMVCNLPIVSVDVGDVRELMGDAPGYRLCEFDAQSLAQGLAEVLSPQAAPTIRTTLQWLSTQAIAERIIAIYDTIETKRST